jgi:hypothetical protein
LSKITLVLNLRTLLFYHLDPESYEEEKKSYEDGSSELSKMQSDKLQPDFIPSYESDDSNLSIEAYESDDNKNSKRKITIPVQISNFKV